MPPKSNNKNGTQNGGSNRRQQKPVRKPIQQQSMPSKKSQAPQVHLSMCARDYARCAVNPFTGPLACIPDAPALHTRRVRVFSKGVLSTGTTGFGFITLTPRRSAYNNGSFVYFTDSTYAGSTISPNTSVTGVKVATSNADYAAAQIGADANQVQYRVVSSGLRIKYRGTLLNRGGTMYALHEPTHDNLDTSSITDLAAQEDTRKFVVNDKWTTVLYKPVLSSDNDFVSNANTTVNDVGTANACFMGIGIQAPNGASGEFEFEAYSVLEYTGKNVRGTIPSHYDPVGFAAIHTVASSSKIRMAHQEAPETVEKSFLSEVGDFILNGLTWVGTVAQKVAGIGMGVAGTLAMFA